MVKTKNICAIPECENVLNPRSRLPVCPLCRGSIHRWEKRSSAEVMNRRHKLHLYDQRMIEVEGVIKPKKPRK